MEWDYEKVMAENPQFKESDINELKTWFQGLDHTSQIPNEISDHLLLCFYNSCDLNVENTKKCIKVYYSIRNRSAEIFSDRDMENKDLQNIANVVNLCLFPEKTKDGYLILYQDFKNCQPSLYDYNSFVKLFMMTIERGILEHGPIAGLICIFDTTGAQMGHIAKTKLMSIPRLSSYAQEGMPVKLKQVHFMNVASVYEKLMSIIKPFIKKQVLELFKLHPSTEDYSEFHANRLPKEYLPPRYGGTLPDVSVMHDKNIKRLTMLKSYFEKEEKERHNYC